MTATLMLFALLVQAPQDRASLQGVAIRVGTGEAVSHARILLTKVGGRLADSITVPADAAGQFAFRDVPAGTYRLFADHDDYVRAEYGQRGTAKPGLTMTLGPGQTVGKVTLTMTPTGVVSGRITDRNGDPAQGTRVQAIRPGYSQGERIANTIAETQTNDLGEYRLFGLPPGSYFIGATPFGFQGLLGGAYLTTNRPQLDARISIADNRTPIEDLLERGTFIDPAALNGESFPTTYFPGTADLAVAQKLDVQPGATIPGMNFRMAATPGPRGPGVHIRGQVIDGSTGRPALDASVALRTIERPYALESVLQGKGEFGSLTDGSFDLTNVTPGTYLLTGESKSQMHGSMTIDVQNSDIENLRIVLDPSLVVNGRSTIEGNPAGTDADFAKMTIELQSPILSRRQAARPDGTFSIQNAWPGDYQVVLAAAPPNYFLKTARLGQTDVLGGLHLASAPSSPLGQLDIVVSRNTGTLDGLVRESNERPAAAVVVVLVPDPPRRKQFNLYRKGVSDASGHVHIEGIVPGDYKVFSWEDIEENAWQNSEVIATYEDRGKPLRIGEGARATVEVGVIR